MLRKCAGWSQDDRSTAIAGIDEDMDSLSAHVEYVQENIVELQNDLIAVDDVKCDGDTVEAHTIINSSNIRESKYLLEHLLDVVLNLVSAWILCTLPVKQVEMATCIAHVFASYVDSRLFRRATKLLWIYNFYMYEHVGVDKYMEYYEVK